MRPTEHHLSVVEYVHPDTFQWLKARGEEMGFRFVAAGPMVRSSYKAGEFFTESMIRQRQAETTQPQSAPSLSLGDRLNTLLSKNI